MATPRVSAVEVGTPKGRFPPIATSTVVIANGSFTSAPAVRCAPRGDLHDTLNWNWRLFSTADQRRGGVRVAKCWQAALVGREERRVGLPLSLQQLAAA